MRRSTARYGEVLAAVAVFVAGLLFIFKAGTIPGTLFDTRFNMYVLEHDYRWLVHLEPSFWSAPFFYPAPNTITYSDNHLGTFLFYSAFRLLGATRETAFQFWVLTNFVLNYGVTLFVLRQYRIHPVAAIGGAYIFTFPMIMTAVIGLPQLLPRYMVPVAFRLADVFLQSGKARTLSLLVAACAYQVYAGIYIGYFLLISLIPFAAVMFICRKRWRDVRAFTVRHGRYAAGRRLLAYAGLGAAFALALLPIAVPYYRTQQEIGGRPWAELVPLLPRLQSYFYAPNAYFWRSTLQFGITLAQPWNHQLFIGLLPCLAVLLFLYLALSGRLNRTESLLGLAMLSVPLVWGVLTLYFEGFSFYHLVWAYLPGARSIRVVTRIVLVLIYPVAFVFALVFTAFLNRVRAAGQPWRAAVLGCAVLALIVIDQADKIDSVNESELTGRVTALKRRIADLTATGGNPGQKVLFLDYRNGERFELQNLDAMFAGQDLGIPVLNGYSGLTPRSYPGPLYTLSGDECGALAVWAGLHPGAITNESLLQLGPSCVLAPHPYLPVPMQGFSGLELGPVIHVWAVRRNAELALPDRPSGTGERGPETLQFDLTTLKPRSVRISGPDGKVRTLSLSPGRSEHVELPIPPGTAKGVIRFATDSKGSKPGNGDERTLFFDVSNLRFAQAGG